MSNLKSHIYSAKIPILIVLTVLSAFLASIFILSEQFNRFKEESIYYYNTIIEESIDKKIEASQNSEASFDKQSYHLMNSLSDEFRNIPLEAIDVELLEAISKKYELSGLYVLEDQGSFAKIKSSTVQGESGTSTENWGFWNTAIVQLFNGETVSVDKGLAIDNFWVGPKTYSSVKKNLEDDRSFFKYAYIKSPELDYIVSAIVSEDSYLVEEYNLNALLRGYIEEIDFIDSVFVVDLNRLKNSKIDKEPFIIFGEDELKLFPLMSQKIKHSSEDLTGFHSVKSSDRNYNFVLNKIPGERYIVTILAKSNTFEGVFSGALALTTLFGVVLVIVSVLVRKHSESFQNLIKLEQERSEVALELSKTLSSVPSYVFKCILGESEKDILLSFNEGSAVDDSGYVSPDSAPVPIGRHYPKSFLNVAEEKIHLAFQGIRSQFESKLSDKIFSFSVSPVYGDSEDITEVMATGIDVSSYIEKMEKSNFMAHHDGLTKLPNRSMLKQDISDLLSKESGFTVYYLDLDGFKAVNDTLGHERGDALLVEVANAISGSLKPDMKAYRLGGDEFIVLESILREKDSLAEFSRQLKCSISSTGLNLDESIYLGVSIGVSIYPDHGDTRDVLLSKADQAMYESKQNKDRLYTIYV